MFPPSRRSEPTRVPGMAVKAPSDAVTEVRVRPRTVLLIDEALPVRRTLMDILGRLGVREREFFVASDPVEAMEVFRELDPTVVFTEFVGDDMSAALDMIHEILHLQPRVKVVLLTAEDPASAQVRAAVRAGVFAVVQKPLRHEKIRQVLGDIDSEDGGIERFR